MCFSVFVTESNAEEVLLSLMVSDIGDFVILSDKKSLVVLLAYFGYGYLNNCSPLIVPLIY